MDNKNFTIGILSVTAVILLTALLITNLLLPERAMAFAQNSATGPYKVATCQLLEYAELLIVLHMPTGRMNTYALNPQNGIIELIQPMDVKQFTDNIEKRVKSQRGYKRPSGIEREDVEDDQQSPPRGRGRRSRDRRR